MHSHRVPNLFSRPAMLFLLLLLHSLLGYASPSWLLFDLVANDRRMLHNVSAHLDLWQVHKDGSAIVASVAATKQELQLFLSQNEGWQVRRTVDVLALASEGFSTQDNKRQYRDNNRISATMYQLAEEYPTYSKVFSLLASLRLWGSFFSLLVKELRHGMVGHILGQNCSVSTVPQGGGGSIPGAFHIT